MLCSLKEMPSLRWRQDADADLFWGDSEHWKYTLARNLVGLHRNALPATGPNTGVASLAVPRSGYPSTGSDLVDA